jgi:hypothetical protein
MNNEYEMCYVDFDTVLYRSAQQLQEDYILIRHKVHTTWTKEFSGVTQFYGRKKSKDGGWIFDENTKRQEEGRPLVSADDFTIETHSRLKETPIGMTLIEKGLESIDFKVGDIKKVCNAKDYRLGIGGLGGNFRFAAAHILPYKGDRKAKPILFLELRDAFISKYRNKVFIARDGLEMDDEISIFGWESYRHYLKTGKHKYVLGYVDKDLRMTPCPYFNYDKVEDGVETPTVMECALAFTSQILSGDKSCDNIQGLPDITQEFATKYGLAKPRGLGKATALEILKDCQTPKEMYERVVEAYKSFYGEEPFEFTSHRGEVSTRTWLDMLRENAILLYMCRTFEEAGKYDIGDTLKKMGVIT